ncbi:MAG: NUDIX hydrolase [Pirellulaceae bacterium]
MSHTYKYPRPAVSVDCVVFGLDDEQLKILLIQRGGEPFRGQWALPGGFVEPDEDLDEAARRELQEETGLRGVWLEQLYTFGAVDRDPRTRVITVAWFALVKMSRYQAKAASDADNVAWFPVTRLPRLAFDHRKIVRTGLQRLQAKVRYQPIGFELLPEKFTLRQLQQMYEIILDRKLDKRNFRKKIQGMEILVELDEYESGVAHRAARLYRFDKSRYKALLKAGFNFEI